MIINLTNLDETIGKIIKYPDGQQDIVFNLANIMQEDSCEVQTRINSWQDLELLVCAGRILRDKFLDLNLYISYLLGARSDRRFQGGGSNYLKDVIAPVINDLDFDKVYILEPHSDVALADNKKGCRVINPKVGLIYGDGMYYERFEKILYKLFQMGYAASNLVIGVGGILRNHTRDTLGFAIKATYVENNGSPRDIEKDPITDHKKKSHKGRLRLYIEDGKYVTQEECTASQEESGLLRNVFEDGKLLVDEEISKVLGRGNCYTT